SFIAPLFTPDVAVQDQLIGLLVIVAVFQPVAGWVFALDGVLIGACDARYIVFAQAATVAVFMPLVWAVIEFGLGVNALWWAIGAWMFARLAVMAWRERGEAWVVTGATR